MKLHQLLDELDNVIEQGTNDERYKEGKKKQGRGNGIERAFKNALWQELICFHGIKIFLNQF